MIKLSIFLAFILAALADTVTAIQTQQNEYEFHRAVIDGPVDTVKKYLENGFDPNTARSGTDFTYLMEAASAGNTGIVRLLLEYGADPLKELHNRAIALTFAAGNGQIEAVKVLLHTDPAPSRQQISDALLASAGNGHPLTSKTLIEAGAPLNTTGSGGLTPLHLAAKNGFPKTSETLIQMGADVNRLDSLGRSPLMWSAWMDHKEIVRLLFKHGADSDIKDHEGYKAFYGIKPDETWEALLERNWLNYKIAQDSCNPVVGNVSIYKPRESEHWGVSGYQFWHQPAADSKALIFTQGSHEPVSLTIMDIKSNEYSRLANGEETWDLEFKPYRGNAFDHVTGQAFGIAIIPAGDSAELISSPDRNDLPWGMFPNIIRFAVDLDGDHKPDVLDVEYCCSDHSSSEKCEYHCSEIWVKVKGSWHKCVKTTPA